MSSFIDISTAPSNAVCNQSSCFLIKANQSVKDFGGFDFAKWPFSWDEKKTSQSKFASCSWVKTVSLGVGSLKWINSNPNAYAFNIFVARTKHFNIGNALNAVFFVFQVRWHTQSGWFSQTILLRCVGLFRLYRSPGTSHQCRCYLKPECFSHIKRVSGLTAGTTKFHLWWKAGVFQLLLA